MQLRVLVSYHYYRTIDIGAMYANLTADGEHKVDVFADSGAFSAFTQDAQIDVGEYAEWLERWRKYFTVMANLDVIGDQKATKRNQKLLERRGLSPLPVFHGGEPWRLFEQLVEQYDYVALGGMVGKRRAPFIAECFHRCDGRAGLHGFGVTNWDMLLDFPWRSVDSSSWGQGHRYGQVPVYDPGRRRMVKVKIGDAKSCLANERLVRSYGYSAVEFADRSRYHHSKACGLAAIGYMRASEDLGMQIYIADSNRQHLEHGAAAVHRFAA